MLEAAAVLPATYGAADKGRATSGSAKGLLAKVYLYMQDYAKANEMATDVINSGVYSLEPDFYKVFRVETENGPESVFEIQCNEIEGQWGPFILSTLRSAKCAWPVGLGIQYPNRQPHCCLRCCRRPGA